MPIPKHTLTLEEGLRRSSAPGYDALSQHYDRALWPLERCLLTHLRRQLIPPLQGRILELAAGTGPNLPFYGASAHVVALDISAEMLTGALRRSASAPVTLLQADACRLPFPPATFDAVLSTLLYCSLEEPAAMLAEARRVLRPGGRLWMLEHVRSRRQLLGRLIDYVNIPWYAMTRSCRLTREPLKDLPAAGFHLISVESRLLDIFQIIEATPAEGTGAGYDLLPPAPHS